MNTETATLLSALLAEVTLLRQFKPVKGMASEALRRRRMTRRAYAQFKNLVISDMLTPIPSQNQEARSSPSTRVFRKAFLPSKV